MPSVEIRVLGEFEFIKQIIEGVARVFSNAGVFNTASGILLMLLLLWTSMAHIMNPDKAPFPFREFIMGLIGWIVFASPMSPKYDVELTSIRNMSDFTVVNDVPFIAAIPSAIASNFFSGLREIMEVSFSPVTYSSGSKQADPLSTLVKMYDQRPPTSMQFKNGDKGYDLGKTIREYVKNCYLVDHELRGRDPTKSINYLRTATIGKSLFAELKVDYNFLQTDVYLTPGGSHFGSRLDCPTAYTQIQMALNDGALESNITDFYAKKGISQSALKEATAMIYGSYGTGPSPYDIQIGMFQSYMIRDGLKNTSLETFADQMVFQGMRKRVYEKAGERALFNQIAIPVITALECFAFYIAPIMMLLAVLGGVGFAMIKKYMMLILFVNLWSFISIFVNLYTAISVENALGAASGFDPFSFDSLPDTILEVEGFLATSAALTASIPMLAMFLLYGGVHSMMGVMRNVASGSVDGNMAAPTIGSNQNSGVLKIGDTTRTFGVSTGAHAEGHAISTNQSLGSASVGGTQSSGWGASTQTVQNEVTTSQTAYQQALTQAVVSGMSSASTNDVANTANWSQMNTDTKLSTLANTTNKDETFSNAEKAQMAISAAGAAGIGKGLIASAGVTLSSDQQESQTYKEMVQRAKGFQENGNTTNSSGNSSAVSDKSSESKMFSDNESSQKAKTALESHQQSLAKSKALNDTISSGSVLAQSQQLNLEQADKVMDWGDLTSSKFRNSLSDDEKIRLDGLNQKGDSAFTTMQNWVRQLDQKDDSLKTDAADKMLASKIMNHIGETVGKDGAGSGFVAAGETYKQMSNAVSSVDVKDYGLNSDDATNIASKADAAGNKARTTELSNNTDVSTPKTQTDAKGYVGPNKEEVKTQEDLANKKIKTDMLETGQGLLSSASGVLNYFSANERWDSDNVGASVNSHAVGNGVLLPMLSSGTDSLIKGDYRDMSKAEQMDSIIAGQYINNNDELKNMLSPEQQKHMIGNYNKILSEADDQTKDMAQKVMSGEITRHDAGVALGGADYAPNNNIRSGDLQVESASTTAENMIGSYYSNRAYEQASAISQADAFNHGETNINEEAKSVPENIAKLAQTLANSNTSRGDVIDIAQGEDSNSWANKFFGANSHDELNAAVAGMSILDSLRGSDIGGNFDSNLDLLQTEMRNNGLYIPETIVTGAGSVAEDGTLGQTFSHGDDVYTMLGSDNGFNIYENTDGDHFRQAHGFSGASEIYGGMVAKDDIMYDGDHPSLTDIAMMQRGYTADGVYSIGEGDDTTVLGNRYKDESGDHYYLHKNQMKMILD